ncbi:MAG: sterol desaturase family protein [Solirubrobacteraceae bacterium]
MAASVHRRHSAYVPHWLDTGDASWQMTAATLVGLMSIPGLVALYGGLMPKRWSVNSMMLVFASFAAVTVVWVLYAFKMGFGSPWLNPGAHPAGDGFLHGLIGIPGSVLSARALTMRGVIPGGYGNALALPFPESTLVYFQLVFAAIAPILALGSVLGRVNLRAWIPFVILWVTCVYTVNAFLIWGGGYFGLHGVLDYSGGYVIHLSAGVSGFVAAAVVGPRRASERERDAPSNMAMMAVGAGLLWLGWNGFNGGDPYAADQSAAAAILNTNLAAAVAFLTWTGLERLAGRRSSLLGGVNGMITGLVAITPAAGFVNGWGALAIGVIASALVYLAINHLSTRWPLRKVDDTLGVIYTHGLAGLAGGLLTGVFADPSLGSLDGAPASVGLLYGSARLLGWQALAGGWVILWSGALTFALLKLVGCFVPLRISSRASQQPGQRPQQASPARWPASLTIAGHGCAPLVASWQPAGLTRTHGTLRVSMTTPTVVTLGEQQHVVAQRGQQPTAQGAAVMGGLEVLSPPRLIPASAICPGHGSAILRPMSAVHPEELEGLSRSELLRASPAMFETKWLDRLSRVHPAVPVFIFVPTIVVLLVLGLTGGAGVWSIAWILGGYLFWTLTEYWLHRVVFHFEPDHGIGARLHWIIHGVHHDHPNDRMRLVMPPSVSVPLATLFVLVFYLVFGSPDFLPFGAGFLAGYLAYDMLHYHVHHHSPTTALGRRLRELHMRHHFQDPERVFGISAPFWDYVFGTMPRRRTSS